MKRIVILAFLILLIGTPAFAWMPAPGGGGSMTYPAAGVPQSTGAAWDTSLTLDTDCSAVSGSDDSICSAKTTKAQLDTKVPNSLFDAYSILYADTDDTPARLTVPASTIVGRAAAGGIAALTTANMKTLLDYPTSGEYAGMTVSTDSASGACGPGTFWFESDAKILSLCSASGTWNALYQVCDPASGNCYLQLTKNTAAHTPVAGTYRLLFDNVSGALKVSISDTGEYFVADTSTAQTFTNKTLTTPVITSLEVLIDCNGSADPYAYCTSANASTLTATQTSRTIINSYGRGEAQTVTLPAAATGMTFIAMVGTQHNSAWKIQRAGSDTITWSSGGTDTTGKTYFQETNQAIGARVSCITYKSAAAAWSWLCGSVTGTWVTD